MVSPLNKGLGAMPRALPGEEIAGLGWNLLHEDLSLPVAVLQRERLLHNANWMRRFAEAAGVLLAPHGKTTMAPKLFRLQVDLGAWAITLATAQQAAVAHAHGVGRILMANQLVGRQNVEIVSKLIGKGCEFYCLVDSPSNLAMLGEFFSKRDQGLNILVEAGAVGGRSGVRDQSQLEEVIGELRRWDSLHLCGVELYEGVVGSEEDVRGLLTWGLEVATAVRSSGLIRRDPMLLSGGGSEWFDVVSKELAGEGPADVVIRPGCYLTHDAGLYVKPHQRILDTSRIAKGLGKGLLPALQVWGYVLSRPEPGLAIVGLGKRDASYDERLPIPSLTYRPGETAPLTAPEHWNVTRIMDQHSILTVGADDDLRVGDMIAFDISHPCLTFDKWRVMPMVDEGYRVVDLIETFF